MLQCTESKGILTFTVRVVPRSSRNGVTGEHDGALRVRITAAPVDGAANDELIKTLARAFGIPRSNIEIASGHTARLKRVRISGVSRIALDALVSDG